MAACNSPFQMLYRVEDIPNTIKFFHSCLDHQGKLLIIILSGKRGVSFFGIIAGILKGCEV